MKNYMRRIISKDRDCAEIFIMLLDALMGMKKEDLVEIAEEAEVSYNTLYCWLYGNTCNPHLNTILKVATALDFEIIMVRKNKKKSTANLRLVR